MSYNGYNYSPYFRGRDEAGGREQPSYPDVRSINGSYQRSTYTAVNVDRNGHQQAHYPSQQSADRTSSVYGEQTYGMQGYRGNDRVRPGGEVQNPTASSQSYGMNAVTSVDTTGLGGLAYASGMGRDSSRATSQTMNSPQAQYANSYHVHQPAAAYQTYGTTPGLPIGYGQQRSDSRASATSSEDLRGRDSRAGAVSPHVPGSNTAGGRSTGQVQPYGSPLRRDSTLQGLQPTSRFENHHQGNASQSYAYTTTLPLNGQRSEFPRRLDTSRSPAVQSQLPPYQHEVAHERYSGGRQETTTVPQAPQSHPKTNEVISGAHSNRPLGKRKSNAQASDPRETVIPQHHPTGTSGQTGGLTASMMSERPAERDVRLDDQHQAISQPQPYSIGDEQAVLSSAPNPITVDPSEVFNHYEYQRRRQAQITAAAAAKDVLKGNETQAGPCDTHVQVNGNASQTAGHNVSSKGNGTGHTVPASDKPSSYDSNAQREEIQAEMKSMLEKMREYKAKDPSLFSQVWEQVKKGQPSISASPQTLPSSSGPSHSSATASTQEAQTLVDVIDAGNLPTPTAIASAQSSATEIPVAGLPDLGKFPAKRHRHRKSRDAPRGNAASDGRMETEETSAASAGDMPVLTKPLPSNAQGALQGPDRQSINILQKISKASNRAEKIASSTPSSTPSQGTIWPEDNKRALADAAKLALEARPANAGRNISSDEIHGLLDQNPSYIELCEILESKGFSMDRGQFARILLAAVPGLNGPQSARARGATAKPASKSVSSTNEQHQFAGPSGASQSDTQDAEQAPNDPKPLNVYSQPVATNGSASRQHRANDWHNPKAGAPPASVKGIVPTPQEVSYPGPAIESSALVANSSSKSVRFTDERIITPATVILGKHGAIKRKVKSTGLASATPTGNKRKTQMTFGAGTPHAAINAPIPPPPQPKHTTAAPPPTKEDMARKRSFNDIVDLTQGLSDDDDPREGAKRQRVSLSDTNASAQQTPVANNDLAVPVPPSLTPWDNPDQFRTLLLGDLSYITSNTADAQDLPLNAAADMSQFKYQPLLAQSQNEHLRTSNVVRPMRRENALRRSSYNAKTLARDILISAGRHPTEKPLNAHLEILQKNFQKVDTTSDLSTFRWDLVDPGGQRPEARHTQSNADDVEMEDADDESPRMNAPSPNVRRRTRIAATANGDNASVSTVVELLGPIKHMPSRRARKPRLSGAENVRSAPGGAQDSRQQTPKRTPHSQTKPDSGSGYGQEDPDLSLLGAGDAGAYSPAPGTTSRPPLAHRDQISHATRDKPMSDAKKTPKPSAREGRQSEPRQGRPPGSRNKHPAASRSSRAPSRTQTSNTAPARPSGLRNVAWPVDGIAIVIDSPSKPASKRSVDKTYDCQWKACDAKLHNLDTLRKHVRTHCELADHGAYPCLWANCGTRKALRLKDSIDDKITRVPFDFSTKNLWEKHVDKRHLDHLAWDVGEGPPSHPSDTEASEYLSDSGRRSVTPISQTDGTSDALLPEPILSQLRRYKDRRAGIARTSPDRMYHKAHHKTNEVAKAKAELEAVEQRNRVVGLGLERPGALIVTDGMREVLEDKGDGYEDFEDDAGT